MANIESCPNCCDTFNTVKGLDGKDVYYCEDCDMFWYIKPLAVDYTVDMEESTVRVVVGDIRKQEKKTEVHYSRSDEDWH